MTTDTLPPRTHNLPPIIPPTDADFLADLQNRYPELAKELAEFEGALASYPDKIEDEAVAANLQDLLGKIKKTQSVYKAHRGTEKKPWDTLAKVAQNFFGKAEEKLDGWLETWKPRYQAFLDKKAADARRAAEEEAERQRQDAERLRKEAEAAAEAKRKAEEDAAAAVRREEEARRRAEEEDRKRVEAEAAAARAREEEKRIAREKGERDKAEKETNTANLRAIRVHMKTVERLHALSEAEEASEAEAAQLDELIQTGGVVGNLASTVATSLLLDDDQKEEIGKLRQRIGELRMATNERFDAKERKRRAALEKAAEAEAARLSEQRRLARENDERLAAEARAAREKEEAAAAEAKARSKDAKTEMRDARDDAADANSAIKQAGRTEKALGQDADRASNRADRIDTKLDNSTEADLNRTRGDLGTVGGTVRRWQSNVVDEAALRAECGPLGEHFTSDALSAAAYRWMRAHQVNFAGERVADALPGVVFTYERDAQIRT